MKFFKVIIIVFLLITSLPINTVFAETENILKSSLFIFDDDLRYSINKIVFRDDGYVPSDVIESFNLDVDDSGLIKGYIAQENEKNVYYIVSNGTMYLNPNVSEFIFDFRYVEDIEGEEILNFSKVEKISNFFSGVGGGCDLDGSIYLDFSNIDLSNCKEIHYFIDDFISCKNLYIDLSSWDLSKCTEWESFSDIICTIGCSSSCVEDSSAYIDVSDWKIGFDVHKVVSCVSFSSITIDATGWDFSNVPSGEEYGGNVSNLVNNCTCDNLYFYANDWDISNFNHFSTMVFCLIPMANPKDFIMDFSDLDFSSIDSFDFICNELYGEYSNSQIRIPYKTGNLYNNDNRLYGSSEDVYLDVGDMWFLGDSFSFSSMSNIIYHNIDGVSSEQIDNVDHIYVSKKEFDDGFTLPDDLVKDGYTFEGWYDNPQFEGDPITTLSEQKDYDLYAKFELIPTPPSPSDNKDSKTHSYKMVQTGIY